MAWLSFPVPVLPTREFMLDEVLLHCLQASSADGVQEAERLQADSVTTMEESSAGPFRGVCGLFVPLVVLLTS